MKIYEFTDENGALLELYHEDGTLYVRARDERGRLVEVWLPKSAQIDLANTMTLID